MRGARCVPVIGEGVFVVLGRSGRVSGKQENTTVLRIRLDHWLEDFVGAFEISVLHGFQGGRKHLLALLDIGTGLSGSAIRLSRLCGARRRRLFLGVYWLKSKKRQQ